MSWQFGLSRFILNRPRAWPPHGVASLLERADRACDRRPLRKPFPLDGLSASDEELLLESHHA